MLLDSYEIINNSPLVVAKNVVVAFVVCLCPLVIATHGELNCFAQKGRVSWPDEPSFLVMTLIIIQHLCEKSRVFENFFRKMSKCRKVTRTSDKGRERNFPRMWMKKDKTEKLKKRTKSIKIWKCRKEIALCKIQETDAKNKRYFAQDTTLRRRKSKEEKIKGLFTDHKQKRTV